MGAYADADEDVGGAYTGVALYIAKAGTTCYLCQNSYTLYGCVTLMHFPGFDTVLLFGYIIVTHVAQVIHSDDVHHIPNPQYGDRCRWEHNNRGTRVRHVC